MLVLLDTDHLQSEHLKGRRFATPTTSRRIKSFHLHGAYGSTDHSRPTWRVVFPRLPLLLA